MPKVTLTFEFASDGEAATFLNGIGKGGGTSKAELHQDPMPKHVAAENHVPVQKAETQKPNVQVAQSAVTHTEAPGEITSDDCVQAYSAYVGRGNGRNAMTGKKIMTDMSVASFKTATQEQRAALIQKYATE